MGDLPVPIPRTVRAQVKEQVVLGVRPESWLPASSGETALSLTTHIIEHLGSQAFLYGQPPEKVATTPDRVAVLLPRGVFPDRGEIYRTKPNLEELYFFDPATGQAVSQGASLAVPEVS